MEKIVSFQVHCVGAQSQNDDSCVTVYTVYIILSTQNVKQASKQVSLCSKADEVLEVYRKVVTHTVTTFNFLLALLETEPFNYVMALRVCRALSCSTFKK